MFKRSNSGLRTLLLVVGAIALSLFLAPYAVMSFFRIILANWFFLIPLAFIVLAVLANFQRKIGAQVAFIVATIGVVASLYIWLPYWRSLSYLDSVQVVKGTTYGQGFAARPLPYNTAQKSLQNALAVSGTTLSNVTSIVDTSGTRWTGIASGEGTVPTKAIVAVYSDGHVDRCDVSEQHVPALQRGLLWNDMSYRFVTHAFWGYVDIKDVYGDCVDGHARVYVPFSVPAFPFGHYVPGGVMVLENGTTRVFREGLPPEYSGPAYPESIIKSQQDALAYMNGWYDHAFLGFGYEVTSGAGDPNAGNPGEYNLSILGTSSMAYVTPWTAKGSSRAFVGFTAVESTRIIGGQVNKMLFVQYPTPRPGGVDMDTSIRKNFSSLDWASGLTVMEIIPGPADNYIGFLGYATDVAYMVTVHLDGTMELTQIGTKAEDVSVPATSTPAATDKPSTTCDAAWQTMQSAVTERNDAKVAAALSQVLAACK